MNISRQQVVLTQGGFREANKKCKLQERVFGQTKAAMKAAMGLERCVFDMQAGTVMHANVKEETLQHLTSLKSYLWEMLVISVEDADQQWISVTAKGDLNELV